MANVANIGVGALVGYAASRTMDGATSWFYGRQTERSKLREEELAPGGTLVGLGSQLGAAVGGELDAVQAGRVGLAVHRSLGITYGVIASMLVARGARPLVAAPAVGAAAFLLVDEGTALSQLTDYPVESHARGVVGHGTWGLTAAALLSVVAGALHR